MTEQSLRRNELAGIAVLVVLVLVVAGWAAGTKLSGAVIASGVVTSQRHSKDLQHLEGGIVQEIRVAEGDYVKAGAIVIRLDRTQPAARLAIIETQLIEHLTEQARLKSQRDGTGALPALDFATRFAASDALRRALDGQRNLLKSVRATMKKKKAQLREQIVQNLAAVSGFEAKLKANIKQVKLAGSELKILKSLRRNGLTPRVRVVAVERELAQLEGQTGDLTAGIAQLRTKSSEIELKILEIAEQRRAEVIARLVEVRAKVANLREQRAFALVRMRRADIAAPIAGYIHDLNIHTVGGVVGAGDRLMTIVPAKDKIVYRVKVRPQDIDSIYIGQDVRLRFKTLGRRTTPEISGFVTVIGADQTLDQKTDTSFYKVDIAGRTDQLKSLGDRPVKLGTPIEAFITTHEQTVLSYLVKPIADQISRSLRE